MDLKRVLLIVMDSVGAGEMPDADRYGDRGADTLGGIARALGGLSLPVMESMGLGNIHAIEGVRPVDRAVGYYAKMKEESQGKDTTTGHWEMAGVITAKAFPTYPHGFPKDVMEAYEKAIGIGTLGNYPASGTEIIAQLGKEHMETGKPIVYTSADSVFQVACHEEIMPVERLYEICEIARAQLTGEHAVSRVIARPFTGQPGAFKRTERRKDFSLSPPSDTLLDVAKKAGLGVIGVGKIEDIFVHRGLTDSKHTGNNQTSCECLLEKMAAHKEKCIFFVNLVDFDMLYGHRNNVEGYGQALREFDAFIPKIMEAMEPGDLMMITADHGCDPTFPGTDHTREHVPLLVYGKDLVGNGSLGLRESFADLTATILELFHVQNTLAGTSFASLLK